MYNNLLLDHFHNPRHKSLVEGPDFLYEAHNSSCGDTVLFAGHIKDDKIAYAAFQGAGCVISQGVASVLTEYVQEKSIEEVLSISEDELLDLISIELGPYRTRCALLPLQAIQKALEQYKVKNHA